MAKRMTTYNTGNTLGSVDVRDLYDNAQNLDNFSNGTAASYADRFGVQRQSLQGIRNASQYVQLGAYSAGLQITALNQVFSYLGEFYAPGPSITLPYTTTGIGAAEIATFRSVGDATLRADLANTAADKGAAIIAGASKVVNNIAALRLLLKTKASKNAFVTGYYAAGDGGGGAYYLDAADTTTADNGGSVIVAADGGRWKLTFLDCLSVRQFGAVGDGTTNDTAAFTNIIAAFPGGGRIYVPHGWYRCISSLALHSGLTFFGDSCVNLTYGTPSNAERPSHIFIDSDTGTLFTHPFGVQMESVRFSDISFGARLFPNTAARGTSTGFFFNGSYPTDIKHLTFERCQFSNFGAYAIRVRDPAAGGANPDWNCAPCMVTDCTFYYNAIGVEFEADNADCWTFTNTAFFGTTIGINAKRSGLLLLISCFGGGPGTKMLVTSGTIRDSIWLQGCQYEDATAFIHVADTMATQNTYRPIRMSSCIVEAPVLLAVGCHFISDGNRYVNNVEVTAGSGVKIDSAYDSFFGGFAFNLGAGGEITNFSTHEATYPTGVRGPIVNGQCVLKGTAAPGAGKTYLVGDVMWNLTAGVGTWAGWKCTTAGNPGTWSIFGQVAYRTNAGTPFNVVGPLFVGEELLDTTNLAWYKATTGAGNGWKIIT